ncbi:MAG: hypothetical protein AAGG09_12710 [Pseudomonadota bacterium]
MRKQYHARRVGEDVWIWDVHRLVRLSRDLTPLHLPLRELRELDRNWWYSDPESTPTPRSIAAHMVLVRQTDLSHPILLCAEGRLMDGMHRAVKAVLEERDAIAAVRFPVTPEPDYRNVALEDLPYPDADLSGPLQG